MAERDPQVRKAGYDEDFAAWISNQAALLRSGRVSLVDAQNLADEVESLAKRDFRKLVSAIRIILLHMLKWDKQPENRGASWRRSINAARDRVWGELASSPSFQRRLPEAIERAYPSARDRASLETGVFPHLFAEQCPYSWDEIMGRLHDLEPDRVPENLNSEFQGTVPLNDDD